MPMPVLMPALSPTMEEGKLAKWLVAEGQKIRAGDIIAEIETDKATMEVEAAEEGVVGQLLVAEGTDKVKVNTPIAMLLAEGEAAPAKVAGVPSAPTTPAVTPASLSASATPAPEAARAPVATPAPPRPPQAVNGHAASQSVGTRVAVSPLARRLAAERGIDLAALRGSGPHGRIIKADVDAAPTGASAPAAAAGSGTAVATTTAAAAVPAVTASGAGTGLAQPMADDKILALYEQGSYEVAPHDGMRKIIAERLTQSKQTIPHFYLSVDCSLDTLLAARERINAAAPKEGPRAYKLSVNDFVIKAWALALQAVPAGNATWTTAGMLRHKRSDVGVAVAVEGGLFTPVIRHADLKTLGEISNEMRDLAERARKRRLAPHEYQGGTTSISNLGMFGIKSFDAVINPPHATILAVGAGERRPVVGSDGQLTVATMMTCTLSCDHRVVDGAIGATMLNAFRALVEDPVRMLV